MKKRFSKLLATLALICGVIFASTNLGLSTPAYAVPTVDGNSTEGLQPDDEDDKDDNNDSENEDKDDENNSENEDDNNKNKDKEDVNVCKDETMSVSWFICSAGRAIGKGIDALYNTISDLLIVQPITTDSNSAIYQVWKCIRDIANIFFVIMMLIVICSQLTGFGINNYGIKRILPRLIIAAIAVNLSFFICSLAVDVSNIAGVGLRNVLINIKEAIPNNGNGKGMEEVSYGTLFGFLTGGTALAAILIDATTGLSAFFWIVLITMVGALITVIIGLVTIAARQGLVAVLIMIAPLAFIAYMLPNTESWFKRWYNLFSRMLIFYPMFSILFGASDLIGWTFMTSGLGNIWIAMGLAVQILPLFLSIQLMKMSGTMLGSLNSALTRATAPLQSGIRNWGTSHADQNRQRHLAHSNSAGAHMRRYLDYRKELRSIDTKHSEQARANIATTRAYKKLASYAGRDADGNDIWNKKPNRFTRNAKLDSLHSLRAETAKTAFNNTISAYNFANNGARALSAATGEAFLDYSTQQFRTKNEAQSDQTWLLDQYLSASTTQQTNPDRYNRLIRNGAGSLRHLGESSIMGQVISESVAIEERRRREGRVIANKFGVDKKQFRAMVHNVGKINDNGREVNAEGKPIEDDQFRFIKGYENQHREWDTYIAQHEDTGEEISKEKYDSLNPSEREHYRKIRYMNITNDNGDPVQKVFFDDAGYMKELLGDDIMIGDPINERYSVSIGVGREGTNEKTGSLRKYYTTIASTLDTSGYKKKSAEYNAQLISQLRNGFITSMGQLNIARLQALKNPTKPGDFLVNEAESIKKWAGIIQSVHDEELFQKYFPDEDIMNYRNVNDEALKGYEWGYNEKGKLDWVQVDTLDPTLEQKKNYIKHILIPQVAQKIFGMINREATPTVRDNQKPDSVKALDKLAQAIFEAHNNNENINLDINKKLNPNIDLFDGGNPDELKQTINKALRELGYDNNGKKLSSSDGSNNSSGGGNRSGGGNSGSQNDSWNGDPISPRTGGGGGSGGSSNAGGGGKHAPRSSGGSNGSSSSYQGQDINDQYITIEDSFAIEREIADIFSKPGADYDSIANDLMNYFSSGIFDSDTINHVDREIYENQPDYAERTPDEIVNNAGFEQKYIRNLKYAIDGIVNHFIAKNRP